MPGVGLRPADASDLERLLEWRNDPWIMSLGSRGRKVGRLEHERWYHEVLQSEDYLLFIILVDGQPAGQVRFKRVDERSATVAIYLLRSYTGQGLGVTALKSASREAMRHWSIPQVFAFVLDDNRASQSAFRKAGYRNLDGRMEAPEGHYVFVLEEELDDS